MSGIDSWASRAAPAGRLSISGRRRRSYSLGRRATLIGILGTLGVAVLTYPSAAAWLSARDRYVEVSGYVNAAAELPSADQQRLLVDARTYNAQLPRGPLRDPYAIGPSGEQLADVADSEGYFRQLVVESTDVIARIRIPELGVDLPIRHGTTDDVLSRGIGHLFGSALPVGGPSTHAVLSGHSGAVNGIYFDQIDTLELGDTFSISVLGEDLHYEVDQILTVLPDEASALQVVEGRDIVTLLTCTPVGVNSHRLLVRGERVSPDDVDESTELAMPSAGEHPGFPWWVVSLSGGAISSFVLASLTGVRRSGGCRRS